MPSNSKFTINNNGDTSVRISRSVQDVSDVSQDSIFCTDEDGNTAIRVITAQESLPAADPDSVFGKDTNGNTAMRVVGASGGGGDPVINSLSVTPSTSAQTITPETGVDGFAPVNVSAVDASIDENIVAENIKDGVTILGVTGSVVELNGETKTVIPHVYGQTIYPTNPKNGITEITVNAVTSSIDANISAENIKKDVQILGVTGTYTGSAPAHYIEFEVDNTGTLKKGSNVINLTGVKDVESYGLAYSYYNSPASFGALNLSDIESLTNSNSMTYTFYNCSGITSVNLSGLKKVTAQNALYFCFANNSNITTADLSGLEVLGNSFYIGASISHILESCPRLVSVNLSSLVYIEATGQWIATELFRYDTSLTTVDLSSLSTITNGAALAASFTGCTAFAELKLPALRNVTSAAVARLTEGTTGVTIHLPSNLNGVISASDVGGTNTVLSFDLPATVILTGANSVSYERNPKYDTATALAWRVQDTGTVPNYIIDWTPYYTSGTTDPAVSDTIYSDSACTVAVTTISSIA